MSGHVAYGPDFLEDYLVEHSPDSWGIALSLQQAKEVRDALHEREAALAMLRDAWNTHMATCPQHAALPVLDPPSQADLDAWRDAPSGTASA